MKEISRDDLFKYGVISPLITEDTEKVRQFCEEASKKTYYFKGKDYNFSSETLRKWYYKYRNNGFDDLKRKARSDKNSSRKLNEEQIQYIIDLKNKFPRITTKKIYNILKEDGYLDDSINIQCFYRYIRTNELKRSITVDKERRRYEKQHPNDTWQADSSVGPYILVDGKKYRTYLIHFIDDNSRLIVGYGFFFNDNAKNVQIVFKKAIETYGVPKQIYLDNGKSYKNKQLEIICARLGVKLTHTHAYDPEAKGKVERCFRTIKDGWMYCSDWNKFKSLEELEKDYGEYLHKNYINKIHSELKDTPNNVWHNGMINRNKKIIDKNKLDEMFMYTETRKVSNDRTISFNNKLYEVPYKYVKTDIEIRYYVDNPEEIWIYVDEEKKEKCTLLDKEANSKVIRKNNINYEKLVNKEDDVIEKEDDMVYGGDE